MGNNKAEDFILKAILLLIAIIPIIYFNQIENVPLKAFILGTGSWGFGLIFKMIFHRFVVLQMQNKNKSLALTSVTNGLISGICELSAAYVIIWLMKDKFSFNYYAIIAFGLAIGSLESIIVAFNRENNLFKGTALEESSKKVLEFLHNLKGRKYYCFNIMLPIIERTMATFIHISTRGLVFITIITGNVIPFLIALFVFIIADGYLGYYYHLSGKLATGIGIIQIYLYLIVLTIISTIIFITLINPYKDIAL